VKRLDHKGLFLVVRPDPRRRILNEFDLRSETSTGRTWQYRVDATSRTPSSET